MTSQFKTVCDIIHADNFRKIKGGILLLKHTNSMKSEQSDALVTAKSTN